MNARKKVFLSIVAQPDNLGDAEIRGIAARLVEREGRQLHVFAGRMPDAYVRCVGLHTSAVLYRSPVRFTLALLLSIAQGRADFLLSPGPYVLSHRRAAPRPWLTLLLCRAVQARGGRLIAVGRALHGKGSPAPAERLLARRADVFTVRDATSAGVFGDPHLQVTPDLAFSEDRRSPAQTRKNLAVLSFRGDRDLPDAFVEGLVQSLRDAEFEPTFVTQVQRDDARHHRLSAALRCRSVLWGAHAHDEQLARVRHEFEAAAWVISDRLHANIFGLQAGASPVAVVRAEPDKVVKCIQHLVPLLRLDPAAEAPWRDVAWTDSAHHEAVQQATAQARAQLHDILDRLSTATSSPSTKGFS